MRPTRLAAVPPRRSCCAGPGSPERLPGAPHRPQASSSGQARRTSGRRNPTSPGTQHASAQQGEHFRGSNRTAPAPTARGEPGARAPLHAPDSSPAPNRATIGARRRAWATGS
jgi:hypothetical protein